MPWSSVNKRVRRQDALRAAFKAALLTYTAITSFPVRYLPLSPGLDPSWKFAINYFADRHILFGDRLAWTYGPLGFLYNPMDIGTNLNAALVFQVSLWFLFLSLMAFLAFTDRVTLLQLSLFTAFLSLGANIYGFFIICFLTVLLLSVALFEKRWEVYFSLVILLTVTSVFIRIHDAIFALSSVFLFLLASVFTDKKKALKAVLIAAAGTPLLYVLFFLVYNPHLSDMYHYIRGMAELGSGYSIAMSKPAEGPAELYYTLAIAVLYCLLAALLYVGRQRSFLICFLVSLPLFIEFKHSFVRPGGRASIFFYFVLLIMGLVVLFTDMTAKKNRPGIIIVIAGITLSCILALNINFPVSKVLRSFNGLNNLPKIKALLNLNETRAKLKVKSDKALKQDKLPIELLKKIGEAKVGIFSDEIMYAAANNLNYTPFPVPQLYGAYTAYLDRMNSDFLEDKGPDMDLILAEWKSIDGRHPLINVPATWLSMFRWYDTYERSGEVLLLKRRSVPRFNSLELVEKVDCPKDSAVWIPMMDNPVAAKVYMRLNARGKFLKALYKVPGVNMKLMGYNNYTADFRVVPDTLKDCIVINTVPVCLDDLGSFLSGKDAGKRVVAFKFWGEGLKCYTDNITVEFYRVPEVSLTFEHAGILNN